MFVTEELVQVAIGERAEEARRAALERQAAKGRRRWLWRVEPGQEGAFRSLLGWFLTGQREVEAAEPPRAAPQRPKPATVEQEDLSWPESVPLFPCCTGY